MFGPQSLFLFVVPTIAALNSPSYRSGNLGSTILSSANFSIPEDLKKPAMNTKCPVRPSHTLALCQTQIHITGGQRHLGLSAVSKTVLNSTPWGRIPRPASKPPSCCVRVLVVLTLCYALRRLSNNIQEALSHPVLTGNRRIHPLVERKASYPCFLLESIVVPQS